MGWIEGGEELKKGGVRVWIHADAEFPLACARFKNIQRVKTGSCR